MWSLYFQQTLGRGMALYVIMAVNTCVLQQPCLLLFTYCIIQSNFTEA